MISHPSGEQSSGKIQYTLSLHSTTQRTQSEKNTKGTDYKLCALFATFVLLV